MFNDWLTNVKKVIMEPTNFYKKMKTKGGYEKPLKFAVMNLVAVAVLATGVSLVTGVFSVGGAVSSVVELTVGGIVAVFVAAAFYHVLLKLVGGKGSFEATLRVIAYASALGLIGWIPVINVIVGIYGLYINAVGFSTVHKISNLRAFGVVILPTVLIILLAALSLGFTVAALRGI